MSYGGGGIFGGNGDPSAPEPSSPTYVGLLAIGSGLLGGYQQGKALAYQRQMAAIAQQRANALEQSLVQSRQVGNQTKQENADTAQQRLGLYGTRTTAYTQSLQNKDQLSAERLINQAYVNGEDPAVIGQMYSDFGKTFGRTPNPATAADIPTPTAGPTGNPPGTAAPAASAAPVSSDPPVPAGTPVAWAPQGLPPGTAPTTPITLPDGTSIGSTPAPKGSPPGIALPPTQTLSGNFGNAATPVPGKLALPPMTPPVVSPPVVTNGPLGGMNPFLPQPATPDASAAVRIPQTAPPAGSPPTGNPFLTTTYGGKAITPEQTVQNGITAAGLGIKGKLADNTIQHTANADELAWRKTVSDDITASANDPTGIQAAKVLSAMSQAKQYGYDSSFLPPVPGTPNPTAPGGYNPRVALNPQQVGQMASANAANVNSYWKPILSQATIQHQKTQDAQSAQKIADAESNAAFNQNIAGQHVDLEAARLNLDKARQQALTNPVAAAAKLDSNLATYSNDLYATQNGANKLDKVKYLNSTTGATSPTDDGDDFQINPKWSSSEVGRQQHITALKQQIADTQALRNSIKGAPPVGVTVAPGSPAPMTFPNFQTPPPGAGPILPVQRGTAIPKSILRPVGSTANTLQPKIKPTSQAYAGF